MTAEKTIENLWEPADIGRRVQLLRKVLPNKPMDEAKLKNLLEVAEEADQVKLKVLYNAVIKGVNEYNKNSSQIKLKNWKSAEKELDSYIDVLWAKYIDHERTFPNLLSVIGYLKLNKWKIAKSRAYEHHKEGKIKQQENGTFRLSDVEKYAATYLQMSNGKTAAGVLEKYAEEKARVELDKEKEKLKQIQHKNKMADGLFVPREAFEQELAKRAAVLKSDDENDIRGGVDKIIALVGGDPAKAPVLLEYLMDKSAERFNRYSGDKEFKVPAPAAAAAAAALQDDPEDEDE